MNTVLKEFNEAFGKINEAYHEAAVKLGLSDTEMEIFYIFYIYGSGCRQSVLYKESGLTKSTVNSAIRKLQRDGILYLMPGEGRNTLVYATEKGEELIRNTIEKVIRIESTTYGGWSPEDQKTFIRLNRVFASEMKRMVEEL